MLESLQDLILYGVVTRHAGRPRIDRLVQLVYQDAMDRAIAAVKAKATRVGRDGPVPISIGHIEAEIAIRQELTESAGGAYQSDRPDGSAG